MEKDLRYFCDCMRGKLSRIMRDSIKGYLDRTLGEDVTMQQRLIKHEQVRKALKAHLRSEFME